MDSDLTIYPITPLDKKGQISRELHPYIPDITKGQLGIICLPIKGGKSTILTNMIMSDQFYADLFDNLYVISPTIFNDETMRFVKEKYEGSCFSEYNDAIIRNIIKHQESMPLKDRGSFAIVLDDIIGEIRRSAYINSLCTKFRHYSPKASLVVFSTQCFREINNAIRKNATFGIVGKIFNGKEREAIYEEWGDGFQMTQPEFEEIWNYCTNEPYTFMYMKFDCNPMEIYKCFNEKVHPKDGKEPEPMDEKCIEDSDDEDEINKKLGGK